RPSASDSENANAAPQEPAKDGPAPRASRTRRAPLALLAVALAAAAVGAYAARGHLGPAKLAGAPSPSAPHRCTGHRACATAHDGARWACGADGTCAPLASEDCTPHADHEDLAAEDTLWLGAMLPLKGPRAEAYGKTAANVLELARRDFAAVGGVLGPG